MLGIRNMDAVVATILLVHQGGTPMSNPRTLASISDRVGAHLIDYAIGVILGFLIVLFLSAAAGRSSYILISFLLFCAWFWIFGASALKQSSPGKRLFRLRIERMDGRKAGVVRILIRESFGKHVLSAFFGIGYLNVFTDKNNQALHDMLVDTIVVSEPVDVIRRPIESTDAYQMGNYNEE